MEKATKRNLLLAFRILLIVGGIIAITLFVREHGPDEVWKAIWNAAPWLPVLILLEAAWVSWDALAVRSLLGKAGRRVPTKEYIRAALIAYPFLGLFPAGRAGAEAARATVLAKYVRGGRAAAVALQAQAAGLMGNAGVSLILVGVCFSVYGLESGMTIGIAINLVLAIIGSTLLFLGMRGIKLGGFLGKYFEKLAHGGVTFERHIKTSPVFPPAAIVFSIAGRLTQSVQYVLFVVAVGGMFGLIPGLLAQAVHVIGALAGDLVPSQLGVTDGFYTLFADKLAKPFGMTDHTAAGAAIFSIAMLGRIAQLFWSIVGLLVPFLWPAKTAPATEEPVTQLMTMHEGPAEVLLHLEKDDEATLPATDSADAVAAADGESATDSSSEPPKTTPA